MFDHSTAGRATAAAKVPPVVHDVLRSPGEPLDEATHESMGRAFGTDFSHVRVHTDGAANVAADAMYANAFTVGRHVVFGTGRYAPGGAAGRRLIAHELAHVAHDRASRTAAPPPSLTIGEPGGPAERQAEAAARGDITAAARSVPALAPAGTIRCQDDREALQARLRTVRARLAQLRPRQQQSTERFAESRTRERERESVTRGVARSRERARTEAGARQLLGGTVAANRIRRVVRTATTGNAVTLSANLQLSYLALSEPDARRQAATDIPRIEATIRNVWQVTIASGEYAGVAFRLVPQVTYLPRGTPRASDAFLIEVRGRDADPSTGDSATGTVSLAPVHLEGARIVVVAHELAHVFGFMDTYWWATSGPPSQRIERWSVGRPDPANRADLLGMIDPVRLPQLRAAGAVSPQEAARQAGPVRVWDTEASAVLQVLGVSPPTPAPPGPDSEDFDPEADLDRVRREGDARLAPLRESRRRVDDSLRWLDAAEEVMRLGREEGELTRRLGTAPGP